MIDLSIYFDWMLIVVICSASLFFFRVTPILDFAWMQKKHAKTIFVLALSTILIGVFIGIDIAEGKEFCMATIWPKINSYFIATSLYELIIKRIIKLVDKDDNDVPPQAIEG